ncbi:MAG: HEAT repeat domain-containing protein [Verrucomicrobiae bacterium]|nr:HEAT repeat domain-containing protein [Verrucomicrobiae bacterium]
MKRILLNLACSAVLCLAWTAAAAVIPPEADLIRTLRSEAPPADKAIACKFLAIKGTREAVPALAPLLADKELASWARIALEAIPDSTADTVLREAAGRLEGRLLVGVINSINRRRDVQAVPLLTAKLKDQNPEVVGAAAAALGNIGGTAAAKALAQALEQAPLALKTDIAEGAVLCAERLLAAGNAGEAVRLYDQIRKSPVSQQRIMEATRGAILARGVSGLPLLLEQLRAADRAAFNIGLVTARELPGRKVTEAIAAEFDKAPDARKPLLLLVLADRADAAALPTVQKAALSGPKPVRLAAITALDRMGQVAAVPTLLDLTGEEDADLAKAARVALARIPGKEVDQQLTARLAKATGRLRLALIELAGQRQTTAALPAIMAATGDADAATRAAAIGAVGLLGSASHAGQLVQRVTQTGQDLPEVEKALLAISGRERAACQPHFMVLMQSQNPALRKMGLHTLASVGGPVALAAVRTALEDADASVQDEAVRTLSTWPNSWPEDAAVAEPLLTLAREGNKTLHQVLGARGYLQYLQGDPKLTPQVKLEKLNAFYPLLKRPEERRLALTVLGNIPSGGALERLMELGADEALAEDACSALAGLAARKDLAEAPVELRRKALQWVVDKSANEQTKRQAQKALRAL